MKNFRRRFFNQDQEGSSPQPTTTLGHSRMQYVGNITPAQSDLMTELRDATGKCIDIGERLKLSFPAGDVPGEVTRLISLMQTNYEQAALWGNKAISRCSGYKG